MLELKKIFRLAFVLMFLFVFSGGVAMCADEKTELINEECFATEKCDQETAEDVFYIDENGVLTSYNGTEKNVVIPEKVTKIAFGVFMEHGEIESVTFPEGIDYIDEYAFYGCENLKEIFLPESLVTVGRLAFGNCEKLEIAYIGENLSELGEFIFWGCNKLYCISVSDNNKNFAGVDGIVYSKDLTKLMYCPEGYQGEVVIPDETVTVSAYALFNCRKLDKVVMGAGVMYVDEGAFYNCEKLEDVVFGPKIKKIRSAAFEKCSKLKEIEIPATVSCVGNSAFAQCSALKELKFLNKKTEIPNDVLSKHSKTVVKGYAGSTAQKFAAANKLVFQKI